MNRSQFLDQLRRGLLGLRPQDREEILADYDAHFTEGAAHGRTEEEIAESLGDPRRLARELRAEAQVRAWEEKPTAGNFVSVLFAFIGLAALDFVVMLPLLGWLALFTMLTVIAAIALLFAGLAVIVNGFHTNGAPSIHAVLARLAAGCGLTGLGVGIGASLILFTQWVVNLLIKFARLHYKLLKQADEASR